MNAVTILRATLSIYVLFFLVVFIKDCLKHKEDFNKEKAVPLAFIGFVTNFLDTWGIGSFATTQAGFKFTKSSPDETMPGTLNVGDTLPVAVEALLFFGFVQITATTLISLLLAAVLGAILGASIVTKWPVKLIRRSLGFALMTLAVVLACRNASIGPFEKTLKAPQILATFEEIDITIENADSWLPTGEDGEHAKVSISQSELDRVIPILQDKNISTIAVDDLSATINDNLVYGLTGVKLVLGIVGNFFLGALMTVGVGLYAPCMALVSALGMNVSAAFPIMMGSCAFLMPSASMKFIKEGKYDRKASVFLALFGTIGAIIAFLLMKYAIDLTTLTWIIIVVMLYTAITFFRDAAKASA